jgi:hypothetical protein
VSTTADAPAALLIAHPGHELRLHGWMETRRPVVFVLTDGSGHSQRSRLGSTTAVLKQCGAEPGSIYGRFTDAELYSLILKGERLALCRLVAELADELAALGVSTLAGDGVEGYNPSHDLCQYLMRAAASRAEQKTGRPIERYQFPVVGHPDDGEGPSQGDGALLVTLGPAAVERKLAAAWSYPEMRNEVQDAVARYGRAAFSVERLRKSDIARDEARLAREAPFYESHGEKQVAAGHYASVLRYKEHFQPLVRTLDGLDR